MLNGFALENGPEKSGKSHHINILPRHNRLETYGHTLLFSISNRVIVLISIFNTDIALPEDQELQGFLPLQTVHRKLDFSSNLNSKREEQQERKNRLTQFGLSLARHMSGYGSIV